MKTKATVAILAISILLVAGLACGAAGAPASTVTPTQKPTLTPTRCEVDRDAIQVALYAYHDDTREWPTADGRPGDIEWDKLVPGFLGQKPSTDSKCDWQVDSNPEGGVCLPKTC